MIGHEKHKPELPDTNAEDHCFIAGILIHTKRGEIPIEEVTTDDEVLTRKGYRKVLAAGVTRRDARVITVTFSNGKSLTGTPNHPIFVKGKGFIPLDAVKYGDIICSVSEVKNLCQENKQRQQNRLYSTALLSDGILTPKIPQTEIIIELTDDFTIKELFTCIERYGKLITAKFQKDTTCTTKTEIRLIMIFLIWNYSRSMSTYHSMCMKTLPTQIITNVRKTIWRLLDQKPPSGTGQKKVESGTANTGLNVQSAKLKSQKLNVSVFNAGRNFTHQVIGARAVNIARMPVVQNTDEIIGLTTKSEFVSFVAKNLGLIVSAKSKPAVGNAAVSVVARHEEKRKADVYNLTVDEEHEYFANGFFSA